MYKNFHISYIIASYAFLNIKAEDLHNYRPI